MSQPDGSVIIDTQLDTQGFKAGSVEMNRAVNSFKSKVNSMQSTFISAMNGNVGATQKFRNTAVELRSEVARLESELRNLGTARIPTEEYESLKAQFDEAEAKLAKLIQDQREMENLGVDGKSSAAWQNNQREIEATAEKLERLDEKLIALENNGKAFTLGSGTAEYQELETELRNAKAMLDSMNGGIFSFRSGVSKVSGAFNAVISGFRRGYGYAKAIGSTFVRLGNTLTGPIRRGISAFVAKIKNAKTEADGVRKKLLRMGLMLLGIRSLMVGIRQIVTSALNNNEKLKNQLTALKGVLGTALTPAISFLVTALTKIVTLLDQAYTLFTGTSLIAKYNAQQMQNAADSTAEAEKNAKKYKRALASFDSLNILSNNKSDSNSDNSSNTTLFTPADVSLSSAIVDFLKKLKEAFKKGDFSEIGRLLGEALNKGLSSIKWGKIKKKAKKIANKIADLINGFIETADWDLVGKTIGNAIETAAIFIDTLAVKVDWKKIGEAIAKAFNGFNKTNALVTIGKTIADLINIPIHLVSGFVFTFDWSSFGRNLAKSLEAFVKTIDLEGAAIGLSGLLKGLAESAQVLFQSPVWSKFGSKLRTSLVTFFNNKPLSSVASTVKNALGGLMDAAIELFKAGEVAKAFGEDFGEAIRDWFSDQEWWKKVGNLLSNVAISITNFAIELVESIDINSVTTALVGVLEGIDWHLLATKLGELIAKTLLKAIYYVLRLVPGFAGIFDSMGWDEASFNDWLSENLTYHPDASDTTVGIGKLDTKAWMNFINELGNDAGAAYAENGIKGLEDWMKNHIKQTEAVLKKYGKGAMEAFSSGGLRGLKQYIEQNGSEFEDQGKEVSDKVKTGADGEETGKTIGAKTAKGVKEGATSKDSKNELTGAGETMTSTLVGVDALGPGSLLGTGVVKGVNQGATSKDSKDKLKNVGNTITKTVSSTDTATPGASVGSGIIAGIKQGIKNNLTAFLTFWTNILSGIVKKAKDFLGIHSPSVVFSAIGNFLMSGLRKGINLGKEKVYEIIGEVADEASQRMQQGKYSITPTVEDAEGGVDSFATTVESSVNSLLDKLQTIAENVTFVIPNITLGTVVPYSVKAAGSNKGSGEKEEGVLLSTEQFEELISVLTQLSNGEREFLGQKLDKLKDIKAVFDTGEATDSITGEINKRARITGKSPLVLM